MYKRKLFHKINVTKKTNLASSGDHNIQNEPEIFQNHYINTITSLFQQYVHNNNVSQQDCLPSLFTSCVTGKYLLWIFIDEINLIISSLFVVRLLCSLNQNNC